MESFLKDNLLELRENLWNNKFCIAREGQCTFTGPHMMHAELGLPPPQSGTPLFYAGSMRWVCNLSVCTSEIGIRFSEPIAAKASHMTFTIILSAGSDRTEINETVLAGDYAHSGGKLIRCD